MSERSKNSDYDVRAAQTSDADEIIGVVNAICGEGLWMMTDRYFPTPQWERALSASLDGANHLLYIAELPAQIVGWCRVFPNELGDKALHVGDIGIGILREWRGQGIGSALLRVASRAAREQGYRKLTLSAFSSNVRALTFFRHRNFVQTGIRHKQFVVNGAYVDEILLETFLTTLL